MGLKTGIKGKGQYHKRPRTIDDARRNEIVLSSLGLATAAAYRVADRRSMGRNATVERDIDDAKQEAILAMLKRAESYDEKGEITIGQHVFQVVKTEVRRNSSSFRRGMTLPKHATDFLCNAKRWMRGLGLPESEASIRTACEHHGMANHMIETAVDSYRFLNSEVRSLDSWDCSSQSDTGPIDRRELVGLMFKRMSPLQRKIFELRYFCDMTFKEIGENLGYSFTYVHKVHGICLSLLAEQFAEHAEVAA